MAERTVIVWPLVLLRAARGFSSDYTAVPWCPLASALSLELLKYCDAPVDVSWSCSPGDSASEGFDLFNATTRWCPRRVMPVGSCFLTGQFRGTAVAGK